MTRKISKKAQVPSTITWFVSFAIVVFIIIFFLVFVTELQSFRGAGGPNVVYQFFTGKQGGIALTPTVGSENTEIYVTGSMRAQRALITFLNMPADLDHTDASVRDFILNSQDVLDIKSNDRTAKIDSLTGQFLEDNFPLSSASASIYSEKTAWLRIPKTMGVILPEEVPEFILLYYDGQTLPVADAERVWPKLYCDNAQRSVLIFSENKKIGLCAKE